MPHCRHQALTGVIAVALVLGVTPPGGAQTVATDPPGFTKQEFMVPMRDGIRLHTLVFTPTAPHDALPIMFIRTPYGISAAGNQLTASLKELAADGYIFAFQDIRGRYASEGQFVMQRAPHDPKDPHGVDEGTDAYDTIDWLVKQVPNNNGRVGMTGVSYPGWLTVMAMLDPHPALKAVSPQASPVDMFLGDDFHHNGAFRLSYGFEYAVRMETGKEQQPFAFDRYDTYDWYLHAGALSNFNTRYLHDKIPTWNDFVAHPNYDQFWQRQTAIPYMNRVTVPTLSVAGWWDQEDFYGPVTIFEHLEKYDTQHMNYLVVGPWNHGGWMGPEGQKLGAIDFGSPTSLYFRQHILAPFFAHFLKDQPGFDLPKATTFEGGADTWQKYDSWPPKTGVTPQRLYFQANGGASFDAPKPAAGDSGFDTFVSDPRHPVPYRQRPIPPTYFPTCTEMVRVNCMPGGSGWTTWLVQDQRFVDGRPDVMTFETAPLTHDVTIAGAIRAHVFAATTGSDADWIVKLIDEYPDTMPQTPAFAGYELMVANDVFRGRFREGFVTPHPTPPNQVEEYSIDLHTQDYRFLAGHRIMVQVQSTWFPLIDRNPQRYVANIFEATDADFHAARESVYRSGAHASYIELPIQTGPPAQ
jgi:putative CocE/NonD family hydrolase